MSLKNVDIHRLALKLEAENRIPSPSTLIDALMSGFSNPGKLRLARKEETELPAYHPSVVAEEMTKAVGIEPTGQPYAHRHYINEEAAIARLEARAGNHTEASLHHYNAAWGHAEVVKSLTHWIVEESQRQPPYESYTRAFEATRSLHENAERAHVAAAKYLNPESQFPMKMSKDDAMDFASLHEFQSDDKAPPTPAAPKPLPVRNDSVARGYHVLFASPSTRTDSTIEQAERELSSHAMRDLLTRVKLYPGVQEVKRGVGFWRDGAEESVFVRTGDHRKLMHLSNSLASEFGQKGMVMFTEDTKGTDRAHLLVVPTTNIEKIHDDLWQKHGVEYKTVLPQANGTSHVHILDDDGAQTASIQAYAKESRARLASIPGRKTFVSYDASDPVDPVKLSRVNPRSVR